jgi:hypothetical protein
MRTQIYHTLLLATFLRKRLQKAQQEAVESELDVGRMYARLKEQGNQGVPMSEFRELFHDAELLNVAEDIGEGFAKALDAGGGYFPDWESQVSGSSIVV